MKAAARCLVAGLVTAAGVVAFAAPGWSAAPGAAGWWYEANAGLPVAPPAPPSVPKGGLYIENGFNGPAAMAALSFPVPSGAAVGPLVLHIAGSPVMSQPPIVCQLRSPSFQPAQDGQWSDRPQYDCHQAQTVGKVDAAGTAVSFDVSPFLHAGAVAVAILAGGPADQIAFDKPGPDTLAVTPAASTPATDSGSASVPPAPSGADSSLAATPPQDALPASTPDLSLPGAPASESTQPGTGTGPVGPSSSPPGQQSGQPRTLAAPSGVAPLSPIGHHRTWRSRVAQVFGVAALLLVLIAWSDGAGILGGRIRPLSAPLRPHASAR